MDPHSPYSAARARSPTAALADELWLEAEHWRREEARALAAVTARRATNRSLGDVLDRACGPEGEAAEPAEEGRALWEIDPLAQAATLLSRDRPPTGSGQPEAGRASPPATFGREGDRAEGGKNGTFDASPFANDEISPGGSADSARASACAGRRARSRGDGEEDPLQRMASLAVQRAAERAARRAAVRALRAGPSASASGYTGDVPSSAGSSGSTGSKLQLRGGERAGAGGLGGGSMATARRVPGREAPSRIPRAAGVRGGAHAARVDSGARGGGAAGGARHAGPATALPPSAAAARLSERCAQLERTVAALTAKVSDGVDALRIAAAAAHVASAAAELSERSAGTGAAGMGAGPGAGGAGVGRQAPDEAQQHARQDGQSRERAPEPLPQPQQPPPWADTRTLDAARAHAARAPPPPPQAWPAAILVLPPQPPPRASAQQPGHVSGPGGAPVTGAAHPAVVWYYDPAAVAAAAGGGGGGARWVGADGEPIFPARSWHGHGGGGHGGTASAEQSQPSHGAAHQPRHFRGPDTMLQPLRASVPAPSFRGSAEALSKPPAPRNYFHVDWFAAPERRSADVPGPGSYSPQLGPVKPSFNVRFTPDEERPGMGAFVRAPLAPAPVPRPTEGRAAAMRRSAG